MTDKLSTVAAILEAIHNDGLRGIRYPSGYHEKTAREIVEIVEGRG